MLAGGEASAAPRAYYILDRLYFLLDWQVNVPLSCDFGEDASGFGGAFEVDYELFEGCSLEAFIHYHTNQMYEKRRTIEISPEETLNTDMQQSSFQLPFGLGIQHIFYDNGYIRPYLGFKLGALYARNTAYMNMVSASENTWGCYFSPEIGITFYPRMYGRFGMHLAFYYSVASNGTDILTYTDHNRQNFGMRLGVVF